MKLVERMLDLHKDLPKAKGATKTAIERRIKATDRQIDELVYALYELGDDEIRIIERERRARPAHPFPAGLANHARSHLAGLVTILEQQHIITITQIPQRNRPPAVRP